MNVKNVAMHLLGTVFINEHVRAKERLISVVRKNETTIVALSCSHDCDEYFFCSDVVKSSPEFEPIINVKSRDTSKVHN